MSPTPPPLFFEYTNVKFQRLYIVIETTKQKKNVENGFYRYTEKEWDMSSLVFYMLFAPVCQHAT